MKTIFISCIVVTLLCLSVVAAKGANDKALLFYFMFEEEEDNMAVDTSDYANNGIIKGNPEIVEGVFGSALELDGTQDTIEIPHNDGLNITTAVTMEMWVRMQPDAGGNANQAGIEKGGWVAGEYSLYPLYNGGIIAQFNDLPDNCDDENTGPGIRNGEWRHLAAVWDGKVITLYIDGEKSNSAICEGELLTNASSVYIGSRNGNDRMLVGAIDEVRLYNRALTRKEIEIDMVTTSTNLAVSPAEKMAVSWGEIKQGY